MTCRLYIVMFLMGALSACTDTPHYAPVADAHSIQRKLTPSPIKKTVVLAEKRPVKLTKQAVASKPLPVPEQHEKKLAVSSSSSRKWQWPVQGKVIRSFSAGSKGIDIASQLGQPVYAAAQGKVVYSGNGIKGYGNLIIIKHDHAYMTTYAHNNKVFVKAGQSVKKGQKIAEMGKTGSKEVKLYFQVRYRGKPINPYTLF